MMKPWPVTGLDAATVVFKFNWLQSAVFIYLLAHVQPMWNSMVTWTPRTQISNLTSMSLGRLCQCPVPRVFGEAQPYQNWVYSMWSCGTENAAIGWNPTVVGAAGALSPTDVAKESETWLDGGSSRSDNPPSSLARSARIAYLSWLLLIT